MNHELLILSIELIRYDIIHVSIWLCTSWSHKYNSNLKRIASTWSFDIIISTLYQGEGIKQRTLIGWRALNWPHSSFILIQQIFSEDMLYSSGIMLGLYWMDKISVLQRHKTRYSLFIHIFFQQTLLEHFLYTSIGYLLCTTFLKLFTHMLFS